jgi:hypothetical protein
VVVLPVVRASEMQRADEVREVCVEQICVCTDYYVDGHVQRGGGGDAGVHVYGGDASDRGAGGAARLCGMSDCAVR